MRLWLAAAIVVFLGLPVARTEVSDAAASAAPAGDDGFSANPDFADSEGQAASRRMADTPGQRRNKRKRRQSWLGMLGIGGVDKEGKPRP